ncbi:hypothetical protein EVAR_80995_1 [Eumeta japonica]|uniref:Uncharacterized protein n=1 Tax=Eumeta variegata TaxID=151549 RepID=A0A4C1ZZ03_EUMVA|nr:hypothetical protein EVAR_80995_1 [Eumeta japonica]
MCRPGNPIFNFVQTFPPHTGAHAPLKIHSPAYSATTKQPTPARYVLPELIRNVSAPPEGTNPSPKLQAWKRSTTSPCPEDRNVANFQSEFKLFSEMATSLTIISLKSAKGHKRLTAITSNEGTTLKRSGLRIYFLANGIQTEPRYSPARVSRVAQEELIDEIPNNNHKRRVILHHEFSHDQTTTKLLKEKNVELVSTLSRKLWIGDERERERKTCSERMRLGKLSYSFFPLSEKKSEEKSQWKRKRDEMGNRIKNGIGNGDRPIDSANVKRLSPQGYKVKITSIEGMRLQPLSP